MCPHASAELGYGYMCVPNAEQSVCVNPTYDLILVPYLAFSMNWKNARGLLLWDCSAVVVQVIYGGVLALGLSISCFNQTHLLRCAAEVLQHEPLRMLHKGKSLQSVYQNNSSVLAVCILSHHLKKSFAFAVFLCLFLKPYFVREFFS